MEVRKWAAEGLSFLTMDAEVKVSGWVDGGTDGDELIFPELLSECSVAN